uniref:Uncharacterized protein n=1 Tax=Anopheles albimanus TaxID=7167 RepID=A0A182FQI5_ANOAL
MPIIGVTIASDTSEGGDTTQATVLLGRRMLVFGPNIRQVLAQFFSQSSEPSSPLFFGSRIALRLRTERDPFRLLRKRNIRPFDGKGVTLEREAGTSMILVDDTIKIPIKEFVLRCPGLFYGTESHPDLNLLLSQQRFFQRVANTSSMLWKIMRDCLSCKTFSQLQSKDQAVKQDLRQKYLSLQLFDGGQKIIELELRLQESSDRTRMDKSLQKLIRQLNSAEAFRYAAEYERLQAELLQVTDERNQKVLLWEKCKEQQDFAIMGEIVKERISLLKNQLHCVLDVHAVQLKDTEAKLEQVASIQGFQSKIVSLVESIVQMYRDLPDVISDAYQMEEISCSLMNNDSMQLLSSVDRNPYRTDYLLERKTEYAELNCRIRKAKEQSNNAEALLRMRIDQIHKFKDLCQSYTLANDVIPPDTLLQDLDELVTGQTQKLIELAKHESNLHAADETVWLKYGRIPTVCYEELVSIAAVKYVLDSVSLNVLNDFQGFYYEWAAENIPGACWVNGVSGTALFKSLDCANIVKQKTQELGVTSYRYLIVDLTNRRGRSSTLQNMWHGPGPQVRYNGPIVYSEMVEMVNDVVDSLLDKFRIRDEREIVHQDVQNLKSSYETTLSDLDHWFNIHEALPDQRMQLGFNITSFPKLVQEAKSAEKRVKQLQARYDSMRTLISKLETNTLPSMDQIEADNDRLRQRLQTIRANVGQTWKQYSAVMGTLSDACHEFEYMLVRFECHSESLETLYVERPLLAATYRKLIAHWIGCNETINHAILQVESIASDIVRPSEDAADALEQDIQALALKQQHLSIRVLSLDGQLQEYLRAHSLAGNPREIPSVEEATDQVRSLMSEIEQLQEALHRQAPALKANEVKRIKNRIEEIKGLQQLQKASCRVLNINNAIIPIIDVFNVHQLQELNAVLARVSLDLLDELGGILRVVFTYQATDGDGSNDETAITEDTVPLLILLIEINIGQIDFLLFRQLTILAVPGFDRVDLGQLSALDRCSVTTAVRQIAQELVDALLGERTA